MSRSSLDCKVRPLARTLPDLFVLIIPQERTGCNSLFVPWRKFVLLDRKKDDRCDPQNHPDQLVGIHLLVIDQQADQNRAHAREG